MSGHRPNSGHLEPAHSIDHRPPLRAPPFFRPHSNVHLVTIHDSIWYQSRSWIGREHLNGRMGFSATGRSTRRAFFELDHLRYRKNGFASISELFLARVFRIVREYLPVLSLQILRLWSLFVIFMFLMLGFEGMADGPRATLRLRARQRPEGGRSICLKVARILLSAPLLLLPATLCCHHRGRLSPCCAVSYSTSMEHSSTLKRTSTVH